MEFIVQKHLLKDGRCKRDCSLYKLFRYYTSLVGKENLMLRLCLLQLRMTFKVSDMMIKFTVWSNCNVSHSPDWSATKQCPKVRAERAGSALGGIKHMASQHFRGSNAPLLGNLLTLYNT